MDNTDNCDKVTQALAMLKSELMGIREQDVGLMKQLLKIKDTIKELSPNKSAVNTTSLQSCNNCQSGRSGGDMAPKSRRQRYLNCYMNKRRGSCGSSNGSLSSIEEITSSVEDCSTENESEIEDITSSDENISSSLTPQSQSDTGRYLSQRKYSLPCNSSDEHLLISNIKVWKYKQSRSIEELQNVCKIIM